MIYIYMRDDYLRSAYNVISDPNILVNLVSQRVKQLRRGQRPQVESLEKLSLEDIALREIAEGRITYELATPEPERVHRSVHNVVNVQAYEAKPEPAKAAR